jgi:sirohydrochlorin cobaltochelatase
MKSAVLLFAHGARDARWALPFEDVARRIAVAAPNVEVALAYLELMSPTLADAGRRLADAGCTHVAVVPLFLGTGGHVRNDLPQLVEQLRAAHPQVDWQLHPPIGEVDSVMQAMADATLAVLREQAVPPR